MLYCGKSLHIRPKKEMMTVKKEKKRFSIRSKMYIFVILTVLSVALGTSAIAFNASADQIDRYYFRRYATGPRKRKTRPRSRNSCGRKAFGRSTALRATRSPSIWGT